MDGIPRPPAVARVLVVDDHAMFRQALRALLECEPDFEVVAEASDGVEAATLATFHQPDVILLDLAMPNRNGLEAIGPIRAAAPYARVIVLAADVRPSQILQALRAGARGIVSKEAATELLAVSLRKVLAGEVWVSRSTVTDLVAELAHSGDANAPRPAPYRLTARERQVLDLAASGCTNKEIAAQCSLREDTVKHYLKIIFSKTGRSRRVELATLAK